MAKTEEAKSTALAIIPKERFTGLTRDNSAMKAALSSMVEAGEGIGPQDLIRVPMPTGGATSWEVPAAAGGNPEACREITGVLVYWQKHGILWPKDGEEDGSTEPSIPVLRTWDFVTAEQIGPIPPDMAETLEKFRIDERHFRWDVLPYNQFGSGKNGKGKRCKEQRMMFILRDGDSFPILVTCQPGSLKGVLSWFKRLPQSETPYWGAVVSLALEKVAYSPTKNYSRIVPKLVGKLSAEDAAAVRATWTETLAAMVKQIEPVADEREPGEEG